jgi:hypothetical protein
MQKIKSYRKQSMAILIALILVIPLATIVLSPNTSAHTPAWNIPSFAYLVVSPNPVGVGERVSIVMWVDTPMPSTLVSNDIRRHDYTMTITKPDGKIESKHWDVVSDTTGIQNYFYTPDTVGDYKVKFDYAGQTYTWSGTFQNDTMAPTSKETTFTVQQEPLPQPILSYPLPTEYWTRPIEGQNTDWYAISSNWLRDPYIVTGGTTAGGYQPDGTGPNSAHVLWSVPLQDGGVVGGDEYGVLGKTYYMGGSYQVRFSNALVMYGRIYYTEPWGNSGTGGDYVCRDLTTGQELWRVNTTATGTNLVPSFGYLYAFDSENQHGVLPNGLLIASATVSGQGTVWRAYDARTGVLTTMNVTNVPGGTNVAGPKGEYLKYILTNLGSSASPNWYLAQWNSSKTIGYYQGTGVGGWYSGTINASLDSRYDWNKSLTLGPGTWSINKIDYNNIMLLTQGNFGSGPRATGEGANITAVSLKPESIGQVMWTKYYPEAPNNMTRSISGWSPEDGVFFMCDKETTAFIGFSLTDGTQIWNTGGTGHDLDFFRTTGQAAYGNIYHASYGGTLECYDAKTGELKWIYGNGGEGNSTYAGLATAWGVYPYFIDVIADGKIYLACTEHSPDSPWYKGVEYRCINATDGTEIWTLMGWGTGMDATYDVIADGIFAFLNCYDMQVYAVGKGPSTMTVEAPKASIELGKSLVISGTVTDISAGTKQQVQAARFPYGVPAVSDDSMGTWMEYVYMQKPRPMDTVGVQVIISVVDSNGNYREIGTTTSNADGFFALNWIPDIPGMYTVYASFAGSESYWPSHAVTAFAVDPAAPTPTPTSEPIQNVTDTYFVPAIAGLFLFVAIVAVVLVLLIRKRP